MKTRLIESLQDYLQNHNSQFQVKHTHVWHNREVHEFRHDIVVGWIQAKELRMVTDE